VRTDGSKMPDEEKKRLILTTFQLAILPVGVLVMIRWPPSFLLRFGAHGMPAID